MISAVVVGKSVSSPPLSNTEDLFVGDLAGTSSTETEAGFGISTVVAERGPEESTGYGVSGGLCYTNRHEEALDRNLFVTFRLRENVISDYPETMTMEESSLVRELQKPAAKKVTKAAKKDSSSDESDSDESESEDEEETPKKKNADVEMVDSEEKLHRMILIEIFRVFEGTVSSRHLRSSTTIPTSNGVTKHRQILRE
ncbi:hypothetical protein Bca4012_089882 [Brassica carinata]